MKILNPHKLPTVDYREVKALQGNLKDLDTANHDKLLRVLEKRGFTTPLFVWESGEDLFLLDGHQRQRVMQINELSDDGSYEVPYVSVAAPDEKTAKEMLLEITSQYGTITPDGLQEFTDLAELDTSELDVNFDAINLDKLYGELEAVEEEVKADHPKEPSVTVEQLRRLAKNYQEGYPDSKVVAFVEWISDGLAEL